MLSEPEHRIPRFAELDAQIQAEAKQRQKRPQLQRKRSFQRMAGIPAGIRKEIARAARELTRQHRMLFISDPRLRDSTARLLRSLLPPKPRRRGRPGMETVTIAIRLLGKIRRQYPGESAEKTWRRIYAQAIPGYTSMNATEQRDARQVLRL
jgi:hypothetical protein